MFAKVVASVAALLAGCASVPAAMPDPAPARAAWVDSCAGTGDIAEWDKPAPPFRIYGNTYYVGTCGITSLLIARPGAMALIDSGTDKGAEIVLANIRKLGFDPREVRMLLTSHEHFDHVGGMARLQRATGATIFASAPAAAVLRSGLPHPADPQAHSGHPPFPPVTGRIAALSALPGNAPRPIPTPGHTLGATSWSWRECEGGACRTLVYADSLNPISSNGYRFADHAPLVAAFRAGVARIAGSRCDIVLAPHPGAVALRQRVAGETPLIDPAGCTAYAAEVTRRLDARLAKEQDGG